MDRIHALVEYLRGRDRVTVADLSRHLGVTERTVRRDLVAAARRGIELDVRPGRGGGVQLARDAAPTLRLPDDEALALALALATAAGDPHLADAAHALARRLSRVLTGLTAEQVGLVAQVGGRPGHAPAGVATRELIALCLAVARRHRVTLVHAGPDGHPAPLLLDPWAVVPMGGHWYVAGRTVAGHEPRTLRVDHVSAVRETDVGIVPPGDFDAEAAVAQSIRLARSNGVECTFWLATDPATARALAPAYRLSLERRDDRLLGTILADPHQLDRIALLLLGFQAVRGVPVTVIGPVELRRALTRLGESAAALASP